MDTTEGLKKVINGITLYKITIENPFLEKHYIVFDKVDKNGTLWTRHWVKTSYEDHYYSFYLDNVKENDIIKLFDRHIRVHKIERNFFWYEFYKGEVKNARNLKPEKMNKIVIDSALLNDKIYVLEENGTDTSKLKEIVSVKAKDHYLFQNINEIYRQSQILMRSNKHKECTELLREIFLKKDIRFYGLLYNAAISALKISDFNLANQYFEKLNNNVPQNPLGLYGIALTHYLAENDRLAEFAVKRVIKIFPDYELSYLLYAKILERKGTEETEIDASISSSRKFFQNWKNRDNIYPPTEIYCYNISELNEAK